MNDAERDALLVRLDERECFLQKLLGNHLKQHWAVTMLALAAGVLIVGGLGLAWTLTKATATAKVIRANQFILEDADGKTRAVLTVTKLGPGLSLLDENGKRRAALGVDKAGPGLSLADENGKVIWSAP